MKNRFVILVAASLLAAVPVHAETPRDKLLELVEPMFISSESRRALRPALEKASRQQIGDFDRGLYYAEIGEPDAAHRCITRPDSDPWANGHKYLVNKH